jgi:hypothetical protein
MICYIGTEEVVLVPVPRGTHQVACRLHIDLQKVGEIAIIERVRAASLADHLLISTGTHKNNILPK